MNKKNIILPKSRDSGQNGILIKKFEKTDKTWPPKWFFERRASYDFEEIGEHSSFFNYWPNCPLKQPWISYNLNFLQCKF